LRKCLQCLHCSLLLTGWTPGMGFYEKDIFPPTAALRCLYLWGAVVCLVKTAAETACAPDGQASAKRTSGAAIVQRLLRGESVQVHAEVEEMRVLQSGHAVGEDCLSDQRNRRNCIPEVKTFKKVRSYEDCAVKFQTARSTNPSLKSFAWHSQSSKCRVCSSTDMQKGENGKGWLRGVCSPPSTSTSTTPKASSTAAPTTTTAGGGGGGGGGVEDCMSDQTNQRTCIPPVKAFKKVESYEGCAATFQTARSTNPSLKSFAWHSQSSKCRVCSSSGMQEGRQGKGWLRGVCSPASTITSTTPTPSTTARPTTTTSVGDSSTEYIAPDGRGGHHATLAEAVSAAKASGKKSIIVLAGRYTWSESDGVAQGLSGSRGAPFVIQGQGDVVIDGSDMLPPPGSWKSQGSHVYCTPEGSHPEKLVEQLWFTGLQGSTRFESILGEPTVLGWRAQIPTIQGGDMDNLKAWPVPEGRTEREAPQAGSVWDASGRLGGKGLLSSEQYARLSPPPKCRLRCTAGCAAVTGPASMKKDKDGFPKACPKVLKDAGIFDCPERYERNTQYDSGKYKTSEDVIVGDASEYCPAAFDSCKDPKQCGDNLRNHNIGYITHSDGRDYTGGLIYVTLCTDKQLKGPFPIVAHDMTTNRVYFDYSDDSVNWHKPQKQTPLWEGMTSCWKPSINSKNGEYKTYPPVNTDGFRVQDPIFYKILGASAMDADYEWWHFGAGRELCVRMSGFDSRVGVRVRQRGTMLSLVGSEHVTVRGLKLFATELTSTAAVVGGRARGTGVLLDGLEFKYPGPIILLPGSMVNSVVRYGSGHFISKGTPEIGLGKGMAGKKPDAVRCVFENNLVEYSVAAMELTNCKGVTVRRNTVHHIFNGDAFEIFGHECTESEWKAGIGCASEFSHNRIYDVGFNGHCDCGGLQTKFIAFRDMQVHHNWIYSMEYHKGMRFDTGEDGADIYQNTVFANSKGLMVKGGARTGNRVVYNTAFGSKDFDWSIMEYEYGTGSTTPWKPYNTKSIVFNNAGDDWKDSGNRKCTEPPCVKPGYTLKPKGNSWQKCNANEQLPCSNAAQEMSRWTGPSESDPTRDNGVSKNDPGCQSGAAGEYNSVHWAACSTDPRKGRDEEWRRVGRWPPVHALLRDVPSFDFRPVAANERGLDRSLLNAANRNVGSARTLGPGDGRAIGAYEQRPLLYEIPGRIVSKASAPVPPSGAVAVRLDSELLFLGGQAARRHRVFFGEAPCRLAQLCKLDERSNVCAPQLTQAKTYYWRVDTEHSDGKVVAGDIWCFEVGTLGRDHPPRTWDASNWNFDARPWNLRTGRSLCVAQAAAANC